MQKHEFFQFSKQILRVFLTSRHISISPSRLQARFEAKRDKVSRHLLATLMSASGAVAERVELPEDWEVIEVWSNPAPVPKPARLGLLQKMMTTPGLIHPCHKSPTAHRVLKYQRDLFLLHQDLQHTAELENKSIPEAELPQLWILAPSVSEDLLTGFRAVPSSKWLPGIYTFPPAFRTAIINIEQLPQTPETLGLRLLGKRKVQQQAIAEVIALPLEDVQRSALLRILIAWKIKHPSPQKLEV
jgi:hypothetical protein